MFANLAVLPVWAKPNEIIIIVKDWGTRKPLPGIEFYLINQNDFDLLYNYGVFSVLSPDKLYTTNENGKKIINNSLEIYSAGTYYIVYKISETDLNWNYFTITKNLSGHGTLFI